MDIKTDFIPKNGDRIKAPRSLTGYMRWYQFIVCPSCGLGRWMADNVVKRPCFTGKCKLCSDKSVADHLPIGDKRADWKGGRCKRKGGYIYVRIYDSSPYFSMARKRHGSHSGYIPEHRLVMAEYLGRPLESYELVHHKGAKYPKGTDDDRADNRIENLRLVNLSNHQVIAKGEIIDLYNRVSSLESRNTQLEAEIVLLKAQLEKDGIQY